MLTRNYRSATWEQIFKDAMTAAAAIDRLVHHSMILELNVPGYRLNTTNKKDSKQTNKCAPSSK